MTDRLQGTKYQTSVDNLRRCDTVTRTYAASHALNFSDYVQETEVMVLTGALTLTTSNLRAGKRKTLILTASGAERALTLPAGWKCLGTAPTTIASGKVAKFELHSTTTADAGVVYTYSVEA